MQTTPHPHLQINQLHIFRSMLTYTCSHLNAVFHCLPHYLLIKKTKTKLTNPKRNIILLFSSQFNQSINLAMNNKWHGVLHKCDINKIQYSRLTLTHTHYPYNFPHEKNKQAKILGATSQCREKHAETDHRAIRIS